MSLKLISFDLDETLWPLQPTVDRAEEANYHYLCDQLPGLAQRYRCEDLRQQRLARMQQEPALENRLTHLRWRCAYTLAMEFGLKEHDSNALANRTVTHFLSWRSRVNFYPGALDTLAKLAEHYTLVAISNGNANVFATAAGPYFTRAYKADDFGLAKPHPAMFEAVLRDFDCPSDEVVHIGDDELRDISGAQQLGWRTICAQLEHKADSSADRVFYHWSELPPIIAAL